MTTGDTPTPPPTHAHSMSSDGGRSPKRPRLDDSSPASPPAPAPASAAKSGVGQAPQTPPPSVHMSPSWQSQPLPADQRSASGLGSVTFPTPPSTTSFAGGPPRSVGGEDGADSESQRDRDGDAGMTDAGAVGERMAGDAEHRWTSHERQGARGSHPLSPNPLSDLPPAPRLYKLHTEPVPPSQPHPSQNLIELYSLQRIQASVARRDAQGNKINKLRKSYEGKVKALGLEGRSKALPGNNALLGLLDAGWDVEVGGGETLWDQEKAANYPRLGGPETDRLLDGLGASLAGLTKGQLPKEEHKKWEEQLGISEAKAGTAATSQAGRLGVTNPLLAKTAPGQVTRASAPASPRAGLSRPERSGKKRRYDESSYMGYAEGFADDDGGYSTGGDSGGRPGSTSKRQKTAGPDGGGRMLGKKVSVPPLG